LTVTATSFEKRGREQLQVGGGGGGGGEGRSLIKKGDCWRRKVEKHGFMVSSITEIWHYVTNLMKFYHIIYE
jgi:hypothetical protein